MIAPGPDYCLFLPFQYVHGVHAEQYETMTAISNYKV